MTQSPTYICISLKKDGISAKTKCLNPRKSLKRKLRSSTITSIILPKLRRYSISSSIYTRAATNILNLPTEIVTNILSFLDYKSLQKLSRTCKKMHAICQDNAVWSKLLLSDFCTSIPQTPTTNTSKTYQNYLQLRQNWISGTVKTKFMKGGHNTSVYCLDWINANTFVSGSKDKSLKFWNCTTGKCSKTVPEAHNGSILCLKADSSVLITGSSDTTCTVWKLQDMTPLFHLNGHSHSVLAICILDSMFVTASRDHTIRVWDRQDGRELRQLLGHRGSVNSIDPLHNKQLASASGDGTIKIWDLSTGDCLRTIEGQQGLAVVKFTGTHLLSGGLDGKIHVWDIKTGRCIRTLVGHVAMIRSMDYIEGKIISGSYDRTIKVWDAKTGACLLSFQSGHSDWIFSVLSSKTRIVSCGQDGRIMMIDFGSYLKL